MAGNEVKKTRSSLGKQRKDERLDLPATQHTRHSAHTVFDNFHTPTTEKTQTGGARDRARAAGRPVALLGSQQPLTLRLPADTAPPLPT
eukprot:scaffold7273_cov349-Ochromonas_danica.AAC.2